MLVLGREGLGGRTGCGGGARPEETSELGPSPSVLQSMQVGAREGRRGTAPGAPAGVARVVRRGAAPAAPQARSSPRLGVLLPRPLGVLSAALAEPQLGSAGAVPARAIGPVGRRTLRGPAPAKRRLERREVAPGKRAVPREGGVVGGRLPPEEDLEVGAEGAVGWAEEVEGPPVAEGGRRLWGGAPGTVPMTGVLVHEEPVARQARQVGLVAPFAQPPGRGRAGGRRQGGRDLRWRRQE